MSSGTGTPASQSVCLLILNYNGREHLDDCLRSALEAARTYRSPCPVVLVDNRSTEDDAAYVRSNYPAVEIIVTKKNDGLFSLNAVAAQRPEDIIFIFNNDMRFDPDVVRCLVRHFDDPELFAATARIMNWSGTEQVGGRRLGHFRNGWFYHSWDFSPRTKCWSLFANGGSSAFRRERFLSLGGFDPLYRPGYYEDVDLSYRAWQQGWKVIYDPEAVVYHKIAATFDKMYGKQGYARLICRNEVLFSVKNCGGSGFLALYFLLLPLRAFSNWVLGHRAFARGVRDALSRLPEALRKRARRQAVQGAEKKFLEQIRG